MGDINIKIWDRAFDLDIIYQKYPGEEITDNQEDIARSVQTFDFASSLEVLKEYIMNNNSEDMDEETISNIFMYVIPKAIFIPHNNDKNVFALMCNYRFDMEHGLAIVFESEHLKDIGPQDIIL